MKFRMQSISVVIPLFNEFDNLDKLFEDLIFLKNEFNNKDIEAVFLIINDCSTDNSEQLILSKLNLYLDLKIKYIKNKKNIGYAHSLRLGFEKSTSQYVMCIPGDAEVNVQSMSSFNISPYDLIIYERVNLSTRPKVRILLSNIYKIVISFLYDHKITDTNGIFIIKKNIINKCNLQSDSFFINAELIIKSMHFTNKIDVQNFHLSSKPIYKSTSLTIYQFLSVMRGFSKLLIFKWNFIFGVKNGN